MHGLAERLEKELVKLVPSTVLVQVSTVLCCHINYTDQPIGAE